VTAEVALDIEDLREVAAYAARCAADVLDMFERSCPADPRPRDALDTVWTFARGGRRVKALRDAAWSAMRAAQETDEPAAQQAARAAMSAASAPWLHPLARATQVRHILGAAAHGARAIELVAGDAAAHIDRATRAATPKLVEILCRYPPAPPGGGRVGELLRAIDTGLRDARFQRIFS